MPCSETIRGRCMRVSRQETRGGWAPPTATCRCRWGVGSRAAARQMWFKKRPEGRTPFRSLQSGRSRGGSRAAAVVVDVAGATCRPRAQTVRAFCGASQSYPIDARFLRVNVGTVTVCSVTDTRRRPHAVQAQYPHQTRHEPGALEVPTRGCSVDGCSSVGCCNDRLDARYH